MDVTEAIQTLQSHLDLKLDYPVKTSGMQDERPVPLVLIEDWSITDHTHHNTAFAGQVTDDDGTERLYFRFYYTLRVDLLVRHSDEVQAHHLLDDLRGALRMVGEDPLGFHDHCNDLRLASAGGIHHQFLESKETELSQAIRIEAFHQERDDTYDTITDIIDSFTVN